MPLDHTINYIEFSAADLDAVETFYSTAFGWAFTAYGPDYRSFSDGTMHGGFHTAKRRSRPRNGAALVVLYASDLQGTRDQIVLAGGSICKEPFSFPGGRRFHFLDPHGNELAVWSEN